MLVDATGLQATSVTGAIRQAAQATGTSFEYLLATAQVESNLNPGAKAVTSSAGGLFQFVEQTWLGTLKESGAALGYGRYADAIGKTPSGRYVVTDANLRGEIMKLRHDPAANAAMAGAFTQSNAERLAQRLNRPATEGELYMAHFLGAGGAGKLIALAVNSPNMSAADAFPHAAQANRSIFYDRSGRARSVSEVYGVLAGKYEVARNKWASPAFAFNAGKTRQPVTPFSAVQPVLSPVQTGPVFHSLFQGGDRSEPLAPVVSALWSQDRVRSPGHDGTLDLFKEQRTNVRDLFRVGT
jgi:hypothetical protein